MAESSVARGIQDQSFAEPIAAPDTQGLAALGSGEHSVRLKKKEKKGVKSALDSLRPTGDVGMKLCIYIIQ